MQGVKRKENVLGVESNIRDAWKINNQRCMSMKKEIEAKIILTDRHIKAFEEIKNHLESTSIMDCTDEDAIRQLVYIGIRNYKFI